MPLFLSNDDQRRSITPIDAVNAIANGVMQLATGRALRRPRIDCLIPASDDADEEGLFFSFSSMEGGMCEPAYYALRIKPDMIRWPIIDGRMRRVTYCYEPGRYGGLVLLFSTKTAELLAILNDGVVQHERVAATAALGAKYLASPDARVLGVVGSGGMARAFARSMSAVRQIQRIQAYSPNSDHLKAYCEEMAADLQIEVVGVRSVSEATRDAHIISTCTNSWHPVLDPGDIPAGAHVTNVTPNELSPEAFAKIEVAGYLVNRTPMSIHGFIDDGFALRANTMSYATGTPAQTRAIPAGAPSEDRYPNARIVACCDWQRAEPYRRESDDEITTLMNSSHGVPEGEGAASAGYQGLQFATVAGRMFEKAREDGIGTELPLEMFLQDIPT